MANARQFTRRLMRECRRVEHKLFARELTESYRLGSKQMIEESINAPTYGELANELEAERMARQLKNRPPVCPVVEYVCNLRLLYAA